MINHTSNRGINRDYMGEEKTRLDQIEDAILILAEAIEGGSISGVVQDVNLALGREISN